MTTNLEKLLDIEGYVGDMGELVAYEGGCALDFASKPVAVVPPSRGLVEVLWRGIVSVVDCLRRDATRFVGALHYFILPFTAVVVRRRSWRP